MSRAPRPAAGPGPLFTRRESVAGVTVRTVSEITRVIRETLEERLGFVWVTGEIANLRVPTSGHAYFTLKDESAQISAVMWRNPFTALPFRVEDGLSVVIGGEISVYEPRGQYQIVAQRMEPLGVGALQMAFLQIKERLEREGLFSPERKRPLPEMPLAIALVTSPTGAAIRDMLKVLERRFPSVRVVICPVRVQGREAAAEIAEGIARVNELPEIEVMIVGRGGGSMEDLWAFNEEVVARAIAASRIPVISAVGHETDFTISDFVADARALTPTDAANMVVPDRRQLLDTLDAHRDRLGQSLLTTLHTARARLDGLARQYDPRRAVERIRTHEQNLDDLLHRMVKASSHRIEISRHRLDTVAGRIESLSPVAVLRRGYSLTSTDDDRLARDAAALRPGDRLRTRLARGEVVSRVESVDLTWNCNPNGGPNHGPDPKAHR